MNWKYLRFFLLNVMFIKVAWANFYGIDKNVVELTQSNFRDFVFNKDYASMIEFYNSFCGACRRYSKTWKSFANDINAWNDIVKVAAIDCSENDDLCREYEIQYFPTIRYFSPFLKDDPEEKQIGVPSTAREANAMKRLTAEHLQTEKNVPKHWPNLTSLENISRPSDVFQNVSDDVQFAILVYPGEINESIGFELMLDYHREKDFIVRQINSSETAELYGIENKSTIHVIDKELRIEILPTEIYHNYKTIKSNLENYLMDHGIVMQQEEDNSNSSTVPNVDSSLSDSETTILNKIVNLTHVVFQADLEKALKLSLTTEVFKNPEIEGESLQALRRYVAVVQKYSPLGAKGYDFFADLSNFINSSSDGIDGTAYKEKIHELENKTEIFDLHWVGCQGSAPNYRGYSCGLWTLFHYLTIRAANSIDDNDPIEVLSTIEKYVKHFFGCTECAIHFQEMAVERDMWNVTTTDQAILWLWKAHNIVNDRLSGDVTDDPLFPKIKFPSYRACQKCRSGFNFSENEVLLYLKDLYSDEKINNFGMESIDEDVFSESLVGNTIGNLTSVVAVVFCICTLCVIGLIFFVWKKRLHRSVRSSNV